MALSAGWACVALKSLPDFAKGVLAIATILASLHMANNHLKLRNFLVDGEAMMEEACSFEGGISKFYDSKSKELIPIIRSLHDLDLQMKARISILDQLWCSDTCPCNLEDKDLLLQLGAFCDMKSPECTFEYLGGIWDKYRDTKESNTEGVD